MPVDLDAERAWGCATGTLRKETAPINVRVTVATRPGLGSESTRTVATCDTTSREEMQPPAWGSSFSDGTAHWQTARDPLSSYRATVAGSHP
jgi:hypothetical protein